MTDMTERVRIWDLFNRLATETVFLKEGDLPLLGRMMNLVTETKIIETSAKINRVEHVLGQMMMSSGEAFEKLRKELNELIAAVLAEVADRPMVATVQIEPETATASGPGDQASNTGLTAQTLPSRETEPSLALEIPPGSGDSGDTEVFAEFVSESISHLDTIEINLVSLETSPNDLTIINNIFRPFHSIKGVAGFLGLKAIHHICHEVETTLQLARSGEATITADVSDVLLELVDLLRGLISALKQGAGNAGAAPVPERAEALLVSLKQMETARASVPQKAPETAAQPAEAPPAAANVPRLGELLVAERMITPEQLDHAIEKQRSEGGKLGEILMAEKAINAPGLAKALRQITKMSSPSPEQPASRAAAGEGDTVRVRVQVLDHLMALAGELVLNRNQLMRRFLSEADSDSGLSQQLQQLNRIVSDFQEQVLKARMQPVKGLFTRFHRVVRDLGRSLNKQIVLQLVGEEVELDRALVETLADPLTHLIRNSADHGLETPQERVAAGKPPEGTVRLEASHEGGKVMIRISDDGKGIDDKRIRAIAVEKGLLGEDEARQMPTAEALRLIFRPGFSTAKEVTSVSGRGVGMDVVLSSVKSIGGRVDIATAIGKGTTFTLELPLTLAIIPAFIVEVGGQKLAVPESSMEQIVHLEGDEVWSSVLAVRGGEVLRQGSRVIPLVRLNQLLKLKGIDSSDAEQLECTILVMTFGQSHLGVMVDRVVDLEEIVVNSLDHLLSKIPAYAGVTLLDDGSPALILDAGGVFQMARVSAVDQQEAAAEAAVGTVTQAEDQTSLVFTVGDKDLLAVPLSLVSRIEEVPAANVQMTINGPAITYRGALLPLIFPEKHIAVQSPPENRPKLMVLVFDMERRVGLVATRILDAYQITEPLQDIASSLPGFSGMTLFDGKPIAFIDIYQLIEIVFPGWLKRRNTHRTGEAGVHKTVLLAEDSQFFRKMEKAYLTQAGLMVIEAEDGEQAFRLLESNHVDLLVTDIEMPNMDGFELARKVRSTPQFRGLPIVAVTSRSNDEDRRQGMAAGIDSYQVKLERESLLDEVERLLQGQPAAAGGPKIINPPMQGKPGLIPPHPANR